MSRWLALMASLLLPFQSALAGAEKSASFAMFSAVYEAKVKVIGGQINMSAQTADQQQNAAPYVFSYEVIPGKFASLFTDGELRETTHFDVENGRPRTLNYELINTIGSKPRNGFASFDWEAGKVTGDYKGKPVDIPMPPNAVDRTALQLLLMADLRNDNLQAEYAIYNKDEFEKVLVERRGTETVKVPAGTYDTVILHHRSEDGDSETTLWCAAELNFLPVRIQNKDEGKTVLSARLKSISLQAAQ